MVEILSKTEEAQENANHGSHVQVATKAIMPVNQSASPLVSRAIVLK